MWQLHSQPELVWSIKSKSYVKIGLDYITFEYKGMNKKLNPLDFAITTCNNKQKWENIANFTTPITVDPENFNPWLSYTSVAFFNAQ